ncbi:MAG: hypothetical protein HYY55_00970 [Candidatus Niyogibacteria bacterium]|nr:MAG: hypothetical protein HYY55_00970 [Candidatus Niyogibacteria bacterium]
MDELEFIDVRELRICVNTVLNTFYTHSLLLHAAKHQPTTRMEKAVEYYTADLDNFFNQTIKEHAQVILSYLLTICGGEMRHLPKYNQKSLLKKLANKVGICVSPEQIVIKRLRDKIEFGGNRDECYTSIIRYLQCSAKADVQEFARLLVVGFNEVKWVKESMGGKRWGQIAEIAHKYYSGQIETVQFLDTVFTLRHNAGRLFDKMMAFARWTGEDAISEQLKAQAEAKNITELVARLSVIHDGFEPGCVTLLERGKTFGWWKDDLASLCQPKPAIQKGGKND